MKILIYGLNYAPEVAGTGKCTGAMAAWLASRGHEVEVICGLPHHPQWRLDPAYADGKARVEARDGVRVMRARHFVPTIGNLSARARIRLETSFTFWSARYWLARLFGRRTPDVVIAVMPAMQIALWPLLFGWLRGCPWVLHAQDLQVDEALRLNMLKVGKLAGMLYWIERFLLQQATCVSTITEAMRTRIVAKGKPRERTWLFPNWADITTIRPSPRDNDFRRSLGLPDDVLIVLYAGNMGEKQGLDVVLDAAHIARDDRRLCFIIAGDGATRLRLERKAADMELLNLRFVPARPLREFGEVLAAGDIHLVVQRRDAADLMMPSKLANILSAGRACIATAVAGTALHDIVVENELGLAVPPEDATALTAAIGQLADDARQRESYATRARAYAELHLDEDRVLTDFETRLEQLRSMKNRNRK